MRLGALWIEPRAVIRDLQAQFALGPGDLNLNPLRISVLDDVPKCFLNDPVEAQLNLAGKRMWNPVVHDVDTDIVLAGNLLAKAFNCRQEAKVLQNRGMKLMGHTMDVR